MSNSLDPDQDRHNACPDLDPNCLQMLTTDNKSSHKQRKSYHTGRRQSKTLILLTNIEQKWLETVFLIAICGPTDEMAFENTVSSDFDLCSLIVKSVFDCCLSVSGVVMVYDQRESVYL